MDEINQTANRFVMQILSSVKKFKQNLKISYLKWRDYNIDPSERMIGIMMIRNENDILEENLKNLINIYDRIFVLDGTEPEDEFYRCKAILKKFEEVKLIIRDKDTDGPFPIKDGARYYLLNHVRENYGVGNWIGVLHGDEFYTKDPRIFLRKINPYKVPVVQIRLCHFFLHTNDKEQWKIIKSLPVERRLTHYMWPGTPEDRFFYDTGRVNYNPKKHSLVVPYERNHKRILFDELIIKQYNYRNPKQMKERAIQRIKTKWQNNHYEHIKNEDLFFVQSLHVSGYKPCGYDNVKKKDKSEWSKPRSIEVFPLYHLNSPIVPIFIGGPGRSGSTYVKRILGKHDKIATMDWESKFISHQNGIMDLLYGYTESKKRSFLDNMNNANPCTYPEYQCQEVNNWLFRAINGILDSNVNFKPELNFLLECLSSQTLPFRFKKNIVAQFVHFLFDRVAIKKGANFWVEQTPRNIFWAYELLECFSNSYFIYVYRDPRDIIASLLPLWWGPKSVEEGIEYYLKRFEQWSKTKKKILSHGYADRLIEVNFENLIKFEGSVFLRLFDLLNLNPIEFKVEIEKAHIGRWKNVFDKTERLLLCSRLKNEIEKQGYYRD